MLIAEIAKAFASDGSPVNPLSTAALDIVLEDLAWWSAALTRARAEGQLKPGAFRLMAARAAAAAASA